MVNTVGLVSTPQQQQADTADNKPINVSGGEYVMNADAVRYYGIQKLMQMQQKAQQDMMAMKGGMPPQGMGAPKPRQKAAPPKAGMPPAPAPAVSNPQGMMAPPPDMPPQSNAKPPTPMSPPNQVPQPNQQPGQTNFATGGYVAPNIPNQPRDWMQYQNYYANMNKSAPPKTTPSFSPTGALQYNYVDPVTNKPVPVTPVKGTSSGVPMGGGSQVPLKPGGGASKGIDAGDLVTTALVTGGIPIVGAILKAAGVGDYIKDGAKSLGSSAKDLLGLGNIVSDSTTSLGGLTEAGELADPITTGFGDFSAGGGGSATELLPYTNPSVDALSGTSIDSGVDILGASAGDDALIGGGFSDGLLSSGADAAPSIGIEALGGAEGIFPGGAFSATSGGLGGALGGAISAGAYAAPALIFALAMTALNQAHNDPGAAFAAGESTNLGDLNSTYSTNPERDAKLQDIYKAFIGDGEWFKDGDPTKVGSLDSSYGLYSIKKNTPYYSIGTDVPYSLPELAISSGRQMSTGLMGLPTNYEKLPNLYDPTGKQAGGLGEYFSNSSLPVYDATAALPGNWNDMVSRRRSRSAIGEGASSSDGTEEFRNSLTDRQREWFDADLTTDQLYKYTGKNSADFNDDLFKE